MKVHVLLSNSHSCCCCHVEINIQSDGSLDLGDGDQASVDLAHEICIGSENDIGLYSCLELCYQLHSSCEAAVDLCVCLSVQDRDGSFEIRYCRDRGRQAGSERGIQDDSSLGEEDLDICDGSSGSKESLVDGCREGGRKLGLDSEEGSIAVTDESSSGSLCRHFDSGQLSLQVGESEDCCGVRLVESGSDIYGAGDLASESSNGLDAEI